MTEGSKKEQSCKDCSSKIDGDELAQLAREYLIQLAKDKTYHPVTLQCASDAYVAIKCAVEKANADKKYPTSY